MLEKAGAGAEKKRDHVNLDFVDESRAQVLLHRRGSAPKRDIFASGGLESAVQRNFDALGDEVENRPALHLQRRARLIDEIEIHVVPLFLGSGARLFEHLDGGPNGYEAAGLESSGAAAHYRFVRSPAT